MDYNDGLANEVQTWDYDAAGNRISASANPGTWTGREVTRSYYDGQMLDEGVKLKLVQRF